MRGVKRVSHILVDVATLLSALLFVVMAALWVRSATFDGRREDWVFTANQSSGWPRLAVGRIEFGTLGPPQPLVWGQHYLEGPAEPYPDVTSYTLILDRRSTTWSFAGFERQEGRVVVEPSRPPASLVGPLPRTAMPFRAWLVPYWFPVLWLVLLPAARVVRVVRHSRRARHRRLRGLCPQCGYDCRATPERCPECGTTLVSKAGPPSEGLSETEGV
jgi:hypothetical protein